MISCSSGFHGAHLSRAQYQVGLAGTCDTSMSVYLSHASLIIVCLVGCHASKNLLVKRLTNRSTFRWPSLPFGTDHIGMLITNKKCPPCSDLPAIFLLKLGTFFLYNKQISSTSYPHLIFLCKHLLQFATSKHTSK